MKAGTINYKAGNPEITASLRDLSGYNFHSGKVGEESGRHPLIFIKNEGDAEKGRYARLECHLQTLNSGIPEFPNQLRRFYKTYCLLFGLPEHRKEVNEDEFVIRFRIFREHAVAISEYLYTFLRTYRPAFLKVGHHTVYRRAMDHIFKGKKDLRCVLNPDCDAFEAATDRERMRMLDAIVESGYPFKAILIGYLQAHTKEEGGGVAAYRDGLIYNIHLMQKRAPLKTKYQDSLLIEVGEKELVDMLYRTMLREVS